MQVIYLSGKLDTTEEAYNAFADAEEFIKSYRLFDGDRVVNLTRISEVLPALSPYQYRSIAYQFINICDAIFMVDGWKQSKTAKLELEYAKSLGKKVLYQDYFKKYRKGKTNGDNE